MKETNKVEKNMYKKTHNKLRFREKLSYGLGDAASNIVWSVVTAYISFYYTDSVGIAASVAGSIFLISRIFDGISDIIMGIIVDKTHSKYGKARPWLLWMAVPFFVATVLMFSIPNIGMTGKVIWAFITYNLMSTFVYTAINLPYGVLSVLITNDAKDRVSLNVFRSFGALIMGMVINILAIPMINFAGGEEGSKNPLAWTIVMTILGFIGMILFFICFKGTKERVNSSEKVEAPLKESLRTIIHNPYWYLVLGMSLCNFIISGLAGINVYYAKYWLNNENLVGIIASAMIPSMVIALPLAPTLVGKIGKRNTIITGSAIGLLGMVSILLNPESMIFVTIGILLKGCGMGFISASGNALIADVIDYGEWRFGIRSDGLAFSASSFATKVGSGLGAAFVGWGLAIGTYDASLSQQNMASMNMILWLFALLPLILYLVIIILMLFFSLEKKVPEMQLDLEERRKNTIN
ncbi:MAG: glycoside-pentoside-hexuronide (GPH):cation symporter [Suipraeoptans sp.]